MDFGLDEDVEGFRDEVASLHGGAPDPGSAMADLLLGDDA